MIDVVAVPAVTPANDSRYGVCCSTSTSCTCGSGGSSTARAFWKATNTAAMAASERTSFIYASFRPGLPASTTNDFWVEIGAPGRLT